MRVRRRGTDSHEGEHRGGNKEQRRGAPAFEAVGRRDPGGPTTRAGAPFAPWIAGWIRRHRMRSASSRPSEPYGPAPGSARHLPPAPGLRTPVSGAHDLLLRYLTPNSRVEQEVSNRDWVSLNHSDWPFAQYSCSLMRDGSHLRAGHRGRGGHPPTPADPARTRGLHGRRGHRGPGRGAPIPPEPSRHRHPRRGAARPRRLAGPRAHPGHERRARPHADGARDRAGQGARPQCRRRRLPDQAVQPGRAAGPPPGHQPPPGDQRTSP